MRQIVSLFSARKETNQKTEKKRERENTTAVILMSEVYSLEPPTSGKVILHTTHGEIDIELFSKECPLACRAFVQLCASK